ncbi:MAG TPA: RDD family protein [Thermoplasmata archaeon]|nr:RDD family protein [Thermoplasmata archaeon]
MIDPGTLANDIAGNVTLLAFPAVLWALLYLLAWEHGPFATSVGFGRRTFWILLPGALLATLVLLPITPIGDDWLAVSFSGALFPILVGLLAFERFAPPALRNALRFVGLLTLETAGLLLVVVFVPATTIQTIAVVAVAAAVPIAVGAASRTTQDAAIKRIALVLALTSGVAVLTFLTAISIPGVGIEETFPAYLLPPIGAGVVAAALAESVFPGEEGFALPVAFLAATCGTLVGADVLRQPPLYAAGTPAGLYAIGGAGVLDLVYLSGLLALGAAYVIHRALDRGYTPIGTPIPPSEPTALARLGRAFRSGADGRIPESLAESAAASREAAAEAHRLLALPDAPPDRPWDGLPVPGWVVSDQANLDAVARSGATDGREGFRGFLTARWLVLLGREFGLRRFGSIGARVAAFLVDLAIVTAPAALLWVYLIETTPGSLSDLAASIPLNTAIYGYAAVAFLYFVLFENLAGRTPGKALLAIAVRDRRMDPPPFSSALLRNASKLPTLTVVGLGLAIALLFLLRGGLTGSLSIAGGVPIPANLVDFVGVLLFVVGGVGMLGGIGVLGILLTAERQRFGDLVAGTWVIRTSRPREEPPPPPAGGRSG